MDEKQEKILLKVLIFIFLSPFIVGVIVSLHVVNITTSNDWIGFYGAIIGGSITYFGIYMSTRGVRSQLLAQKEANDLINSQLENEKIKAKEERRLSIRPYLNEFTGDSEEGIKYLTVMFDDYQLQGHIYKEDIILNIKNIGLGPVISLKVIGLSYSYSNSELLEPFHADTKSLEKDGIMQLTISYTHSKNFLTVNHQLDLQYYDILDNLYAQSITFTSLKKNAQLEKIIINNISKQKLIKESDL